MAIVEMQKMRLYGLSSDKDKILNKLLATGAVELKPTGNIDLTVKRLDTQKMDERASGYSRIVNALAFLKEQVSERVKIAKQNNKEWKSEGKSEGKKDEYIKPKAPFFYCRKEVSGESFEAIELDSVRLFAVCEALEEAAVRLAALKSEDNACLAKTESLKDYQSFPYSFASVQDTPHVAVRLGVVQNLSTEAAAKIAEEHGAEIALAGSDKGMKTAVWIACLKTELAALMQELEKYGFEPCPYTEDAIAAEKIAELNARRAAIANERRQVTVDVIEKFYPERERLELLCDYFKFGMEKLQADSEFAKTEKTFVLEGFVPTHARQRVEKAVAKVTDSVQIDWEDVCPADNPPTLCANKSLVAPFESVTNMYSVPSYYEADPNPVMGICYFILFGFMLSDAGYGILMTLATLVIMKKFRLEKGTKRMMLLLCMGGVSTILWGALFGSWFGFTAPLLWFNPMEEPVKMLIVALVLGVIHIMVGMGVKAVALVKAGKPWDALFDVGSWYLVFLGIGLFIVKMMVVDIPVLTYIALGMAGLGVLMLVCTQGRKQKSVFMKIFKGVGSLYGMINYLSDILSYARLFGLGLATAVIGYAMNQFVSVLFGIAVVGPVLGAIVFVAMHMFSLAINALGAYVHNNRLQFVEFYSKFYEGGGHEFVPIGSKLKYTIINQSEV